jgi:hypothetical protein
MPINEQRVQLTIARVSAGYFDSTTEELEEASLYIKRGLNQLPFDQKVPDLIKLELGRRQNLDTTKISKAGLFWQKWGTILILIVAIATLIVSILTYLKTK